MNKSKIKFIQYKNNNCFIDIIQLKKNKKIMINNNTEILETNKIKLNKKFI